MRRRRHGRVRGPLSPFAAGFRAELESRGYTPVSAEHRLGQFRQISRWLDAERLTRLNSQVSRRSGSWPRAAALAW